MSSASPPSVPEERVSQQRVTTQLDHPIVAGDVVRVAAWLPWLLRFTGVVCSAAWLAAIMPLGWMAWWHEAIGMGEMPRGALVEYLARATASLAGLYGVVLLWTSRDVASNLAIIRLITFSVSGLAIACCITMWDSGMPIWWLVGDAVANVLVAAGVYCGCRRV